MSQTRLAVTTSSQPIPTFSFGTSQIASMPLIHNFKNGDLLFGLSKTLTTYNVLTRMRGLDYIIGNDLNGPVIREILSHRPPHASFTPHQKAHYEFLLSHRDYLTKKGGRPIPNHRSEPALGVAFRRGCKLLVLSANEHRRIHFELDGLDIKRVCDRRKDDFGVTNSELRALYKDHIERGTNPHVFFYRNGIQCKAPWDEKDNEAHWKAYDEYHARKPKKISIKPNLPTRESDESTPAKKRRRR